MRSQRFQFVVRGGAISREIGVPHLEPRKALANAIQFNRRCQSVATVKSLVHRGLKGLTSDDVHTTTIT